MSFSVDDTRCLDTPTPQEALKWQASRRGAALAFRFPVADKQLTFRQWFDDSTALARSFLAQGLHPGDRISLLAENRVEWPVVQLGAAIAGLVLVPLNTHFREQDLAYALSQSRSRAIVLSRSFRSNPFLGLLRKVRSALAELQICVSVEGAEPDCLDLYRLIEAGRSLAVSLPDVDGDSEAAIIYTSGTTGFPKGAVLRHRGVMANGRLMMSKLGVCHEDRITSIVPMFHSASYCATIPAVLQLGCAYFGLEAFDPLAMLRLIATEKCTVHVAVPTTLHAMLNHPERAGFDLSSLRVGTCGGADVDPALVSRCAAEFPIPGLVQVYGLTEASGIVTCPDPADPDRFAISGRALEGYEVRVVDLSTREEVEPGTAGEIEIRSAHVMARYFEMPDATTAAISDDGWLRTGDLGFLRSDGKLVLSGGRLKDMIIRGGENIYPVEIENVLASHPGVAQVAVFGVPDAVLGEKVAAAVRTVGEVSPADLAEHCSQRIACFKAPELFFRVSEFPLTPSGKIRKTELRRLANDGALHVMGNG